MVKWLYIKISSLKGNVIRSIAFFVSFVGV